MTATTQFTAAEVYCRHEGSPHRVEDEPLTRRQSLFKAVAGFVGAALVMSAVGLWIMPASGDAGEVMLMKLGLTLFLAMAGAIFLGAAYSDERD